jgi:site-specific DNA-cytosine methylase
VIVSAEVKAWDARGNGDGSTLATITGDHENRITDYTNVICTPDVCYAIGNGQVDNTGLHKITGALNCMHDQQAVLYSACDHQPIVFDRAYFNQGKNAQYDPQLYEDGTSPTLVAKGPAGVCTNYIVRRLTPVECARLQGFPDAWGKVYPKEFMTPDEYHFWHEVRNTHAAINGKLVKEYTEKQMLTWYNRLHTDSAEYKMWGNGIALPTALYCMEGIAEALNEGKRY